MTVLPIEHECEQMPDGVSLSYQEDPDPAWILGILKEATEADLEQNHYLEEERDLVWATYLEVLYCPYCGERLLGMKKADLSGYGHFHHYDGSSW